MENVNAMLRENPRNTKPILLEPCQQWGDDLTEKSEDEGEPNNETGSTDHESEEHLEENNLEHLHKNIDLNYEDTYF